jgi:hypothetical protein
LLGSFFDPEAGDDVFLRNVRVSLNYIRDSSVGIATDYWLDGRGSIPNKGKRFFSFP